MLQLALFREDDYRGVDVDIWEKTTVDITAAMARQYNQSRIDQAQTFELGGRVCYALSDQN